MFGRLLSFFKPRCLSRVQRKLKKAGFEVCSSREAAQAIADVLRADLLGRKGLKAAGLPFSPLQETGEGIKVWKKGEEGVLSLAAVLGRGEVGAQSSFFLVKLSFDPKGKLEKQSLERCSVGSFLAEPHFG